LYNKPQGYSTSVALATGPNDEEEEEVVHGFPQFLQSSARILPFNMV